MDWLEKLRLMATHYEGDENGLSAPEPAFLFVVHQPKATPWSETVPRTSEFESYLSIFGGGVLGPQIVLHSLAQIPKETDHWFRLLQEDKEFWRHVGKKNSVVIANDPDGAPWVYNAQTGKVINYWWKEGAWGDPHCSSLAEFVEFVFGSHEGEDNWEMVKRQAGISA